MSATSSKALRLVWIDLEMTGLDPQTCVIVEIATIVTDADLNVIAEGPDLVLHATDEQLASMVPVVHEMHRRSGLTAAIRESTVTVAEAEAQTLAFIREHCSKKGAHPLCGNTIGTDRQFLARHMRQIVDHLSYRTIDVSTIKELARRWYPARYQKRPRKGEGHRALKDIRESIVELRHWRESVFLPPE